MSTDHPADRPFSGHLITRADFTQLVKFWFDRTPLPRPVRRRMVDIGMLHPGTPSLFTHNGMRFMLEHAPRSPWNAPTVERQRSELRNPWLMLAAASGALVTLPSERRR